MESRGELWTEVSWNKGKELTERMPVFDPGGVLLGDLYRTIAYGYSGQVSVSLEFVRFP